MNVFLLFAVTIDFEGDLSHDAIDDQLSPASKDSGLPLGGMYRYSNEELAGISGTSTPDDDRDILLEIVDDKASETSSTHLRVPEHVDVNGKQSRTLPDILEGQPVKIIDSGCSNSSTTSSTGASGVTSRMTGTARERINNSRVLKTSSEDSAYGRGSVEERSSVFEASEDELETVGGNADNVVVVEDGQDEDDVNGVPVVTDTITGRDVTMSYVNSDPSTQQKDSVITAPEVGHLTDVVEREASEMQQRDEDWSTRGQATTIGSDRPPSPTGLDLLFHNLHVRQLQKYGSMENLDVDEATGNGRSRLASAGVEAETVAARDKSGALPRRSGSFGALRQPRHCDNDAKVSVDKRDRLLAMHQWYRDMKPAAACPQIWPTAQQPSTTPDSATAGPLPEATASSQVDLPLKTKDSHETVAAVVANASKRSAVEEQKPVMQRETAPERVISGDNVVSLHCQQSIDHALRERDRPVAPFSGDASKQPSSVPSATSSAMHRDRRLLPPTNQLEQQRQPIDAGAIRVATSMAPGKQRSLDECSGERHMRLQPSVKASLLSSSSSFRQGPQHLGVTVLTQQNGSSAHIRLPAVVVKDNVEDSSSGRLRTAVAHPVAVRSGQVVSTIGAPVSLRTPANGAIALKMHDSCRQPSSQEPRPFQMPSRNAAPQVTVVTVTDHGSFIESRSNLSSSAVARGAPDVRHSEQPKQQAVAGRRGSVQATKAVSQQQQQQPALDIPRHSGSVTDSTRIVQSQAMGLKRTMQNGIVTRRQIIVDARAPTCAADEKVPVNVSKLRSVYEETSSSSVGGGSREQNYPQQRQQHQQQQQLHRSHHHHQQQQQQQQQDVTAMSGSKGQSSILIDRTGEWPYYSGVQVELR
jgi:hypothetical protein